MRDGDFPKESRRFLFLLGMFGALRLVPSFGQLEAGQVRLSYSSKAARHRANPNDSKRGTAPVLPDEQVLELFRALTTRYQEAPRMVG